MMGDTIRLKTEPERFVIVLGMIKQWTEKLGFFPPEVPFSVEKMCQHVCFGGNPQNRFHQEFFRFYEIPLRLLTPTFSRGKKPRKVDNNNNILIDSPGCLFPLFNVKSGKIMKGAFQAAVLVHNLP